MYINVFGELQDPVIVLIHPTMLTGEQLYRLFSPYFTGKYCFIAPDQGGHGKAGNYISADSVELLAKLQAELEKYRASH